ncbi:MAG: efflux RND transporter periplasmic adaptor subunit, partial [Hyphomicrobiaceae bacterium]
MNPRLPARGLSVSAALAAALLLSALPVSARDAQALPAVKLPSVSVTRVVTGEITETAIVSGTLVPRLEVLVPAEIDGYAIVELLAEEGDRVKEGQV